ncbi:hypothetical protein [Bradyrhizobium sp.]|uniref:hypothetical protein n=1 Tax=Bradyrhizobium sp. TaxID=376 RepID=UPI002730EE10|nr:hypothetical protein [Bradyrhizobium sp.]MDP1867772.1 hypothetical protein [Bradyrhizobium sp.]MDP3074701.1 hypothetical protein [Bradyrhizobium sp.]
MTTFITRHYPASKLPGELREGINPSSLVTVIIEHQTKLNTASKPDQPVDHAESEIDVNLLGRQDGRDE